MALIVTNQGMAVIINASSPNVSDVQTACNSASDGDTVSVPAGTATWTSTLKITKGITLIGAGPDQTVFIDEVSRTSTVPALVVVTLNTNQAFRLSGLTFQGGVTNTAVNYDGMVRFYGAGHTNRVDHCHFNSSTAEHLAFYGWNIGVVDHCKFDGGRQFIILWHDGWGGYSYGDGSWAAPSHMGQWDSLFIEDNVFNFTSASNYGCYGALDCMGGGREVIRYNSFTNCHPSTHGTESTGRIRSVRIAEIYNNTLVSLGYGGGFGQYRGGTGVIFSNTLSGFDSGMSLTCYREMYSFVHWGGATGTNGWDSNDAALYASGTHSGSNAAPVLTANASWNVNQWVGYTVMNTVTHLASFITANTANTITYDLQGSTVTGGPTMTFNNGDGFEIRRVLIAVDQPGRGQGDMISGGEPVPVAWPHQALEPVYSWGNTLNGANLNIGSGYPTIQENRDFFNNTVKPGYVPYVYPHPLVTGQPVTGQLKPPPPSNLRVVGGP